MHSLNVYQKKIASILAMILLIFGVQDIGYSQNVPIEADSSYILTERELVRAVWRLTEPEGVEEIYNQGIRSVMWITTEYAQASGVLIDEEFKIAVTNEHVTKDHESVNVFFPVRDANGNLIYDRSFYENRSNREILTQLGYATKGRVIAEDSKNDLAIIHLDGIPEIASDINLDVFYDYREMGKNDLVHILGNPGGRSLWRWTLGNFQGVTHLQDFNFGGELLHINADIYGGNSGGPVLNNSGRLIGIISLSDRLMNTYAIPFEYIEKLISTLNEIQVFSITNHTELTVHYKIKWRGDAEWNKFFLFPNHSLDPNQRTWYTDLMNFVGLWQQDLSHVRIHAYPSTAVPEGYPHILFDHIVDNNEEVSLKHYKLKTNTTTLGSGVKPSHNKDARKYQFRYSSQTKELSLSSLKD